MKKYLVGLFALFVLLAVGNSLQAQRQEWVFLGDRHVDGEMDHDTIRVGKADGWFRAIQFRVEGGDVQFDRIVVRFGNGSEERLDVHERVPAGGHTRAIDLPGDKRHIETVDLWYGKARWERRPKVSLFGIR
jgi:hypothetical protein